MSIRYYLYALLPILGVGCAQNHTSSLHSTQEREMTLGIVQKDICQGMHQSEVATQLGSPNIVTKDQNGSETWIYDKISAEVSYSQSKGGGVIGAVWSLIGFGGYYGREAGATAKSQKTLTVVIKFDESKQVENLSYHSSKF